MSRRHNTKWVECRTCKAAICANITLTCNWETTVWDANVSLLSRVTPKYLTSGVHLLLVKNYLLTWEPQWRTASGKVDSLVFRRIHFHLPSFEVVSQWVELLLKSVALSDYITDLGVMMEIRMSFSRHIVLTVGKALDLLCVTCAPEAWVCKLCMAAFLWRAHQ
jgi:hypothetical protein